MNSSLQNRCKLCAATDIIALYQSARHHFTVGRCPRCGFLFVLETVTEEELREMYSQEDEFREFAEAMNNSRVRDRHQRMLDQVQLLLASNGSVHPALLDVGAGSGAFLQAARARGLRVEGNEFSSAAIHLAREKYGIDLSPASIEQDSRSDCFDVITLWGIIEHAADPAALLRGALRLLKPGGLLFVYTPVWCAYDQVGLFLAQWNNGRWSRLLDRRITPAHLQLFSQPVLERTVQQMGFEIVSAERVCEYNLPLAAYLESLGVPRRLQKGLARVLEAFIERGVFFRNNIRLFCRKKPLPQCSPRPDAHAVELAAVAHRAGS